MKKVTQLFILMMIVAALFMPLVAGKMPANGQIGFMDWLKTNGVTMIGTLVLILTGFYIPGLKILWLKALKALLSERVLTKLFIVIAEKLVKSTKNKLDDVWLEELKKDLGQG